MAEDKVISFIGTPGQEFAGVRGADGEYFDFASGRKYGFAEVPKSVLDAIGDGSGIEGARFELGTERTVENKLEKAREEQGEEE